MVLLWPIVRPGIRAPPQMPTSRTTRGGIGNALGNDGDGQGPAGGDDDARNHQTVVVVKPVPR